MASLFDHQAYRITGLICDLPQSERLMERVRELGAVATVTDVELLGRAA